MDRQYFVNTLDNLGIGGIRKRYWLKMYRENQQNTSQLFFNKLERDYAGETRWIIAKTLLLKKYPHFSMPEPEPEPEPEPTPIFEKEVGLEPVFNLEYFLNINGGRWGCAMVDIDEYERDYGVII
ncbi:hypothetical protein N9991_00725 [bacterium]|nr:hypothetical protein [bacterium]